MNQFFLSHWSESESSRIVTVYGILFYDNRIALDRGPSVLKNSDGFCGFCGAFSRISAVSFRLNPAAFSFEGRGMMGSVFRTRTFDFRWISAETSLSPSIRDSRQHPSRLSARHVSRLSSRLANAASGQKLMIVLHGRGDSLEAFSDIHNELEMPEMNFLLLNAPRPCEDGFSWYRSEPRHVESVVEVREKLFALVQELNVAGFRSENIFWMGHSQGCLIACDLVLNHPDRFGGLIGVSGYLWFFRGWKKKLIDSGAYGTPWLITHGIHDRVICPREIREDIAALVENDVPVLYREFRKGHDFDFTHEVPFIREWLKTRHSEVTALHS